MNKLTLDRASVVVDKALEQGHTLGLKPLTVVVLDAGGHLVALKREDGSGILRVEIAAGKASAALGLGLSSRAIGELNQDRVAFLGAVAAASKGRFVAVAGGVLIRAEDGATLGAVGVSGDTSDNDEHCAIVGVQAAGYRSEPAQPAG